MIEGFPHGIARAAITGEIMAACGAMPVIIWQGDVGAYVARFVGAKIAYEETAAVCSRFTLADAFIRTATWRADIDLAFQPVDFVALDVPVPPSTNALFVKAPNPKGPRDRIKTRAYKAWLEAVGWAVKPQLTAQGAPAQPIEPLFGPHWAIWIRLNMDHQGDVTNRIKALEDFLVSWNITCGDQWNDRCTVDRDRTLPVECRIIIYQKP